ncbi:peptidoglycan/xylan/chitin deacetylase (PgdA/CDA1 family) [Virgibacillus halotolerans]|uniref:polysaccharide deacetylase family protein n=1 Tax=Virgibacillus halotolerans TaxID=1071053 RepID=UPI00195F315E|nr:polysaccharide deacetylase family protein [Virgibacillus halotolerans]MBM7600824.1 peptidoglycan/xylan/chitin deacetylase (PgdA/CDA1 family) [Virgibacillus halotolerans]
MKQHKHLNRKGKITLSIIAVFILSFFFLRLASIDKTAASGEKIESVSAEQLSLSFETKKAFSDSDLHQSFQEKERQAKQKAQEKQRKAEQKDKAIYLTFDDGPSPEAGELLDILDQYNAKATFFMLGPQIQSRPEIVERMVNEGFGLGLHGITHDKDQIYRSTEAPTEEMSDDQEIVQDVSGVYTELVRLPYGSIPYLTEEMRGSLNQQNFKIWDWNVDSRDWELKDQRFIDHTIQEIENVKQAGETPVVLLHDKPETIRHLPKLLTYLQQEGYQTETVTNKMAPLTFECEGRCHPING